MNSKIDSKLQIRKFVRGKAEVHTTYYKREDKIKTDEDGNWFKVVLTKELKDSADFSGILHRIS